MYFSNSEIYYAVCVDSLAEVVILHFFWDYISRLLREWVFYLVLSLMPNNFYNDITGLSTVILTVILT